jgi:hypothetical protein
MFYNANEILYMLQHTAKLKLNQHERKRAINVILRRVCITIVVVENNNCYTF